MKRPGDNLLLTKSDDSFVSVAGLSLSEDLAGDESKRIKWCESTKTETEEITETEFDPRYECCDNYDEVDKALERCQHDQEEEPSDIDDVGKIVLCRAQPDDADFIHGLLSKAATAEANDGNVHHQHAANDNSEVEDRGEGGNATDCTEENSDSIFLLLSRAVASHEPLGCAILTFIPPSPPSSLVGDEGREGPPQQRTLALRHIGHEEHLPRERFIECLEVFASKLEDTSLDTRDIVTSNETQPVLSPDGIRKCLMSQSSSRAKVVTNPTTGTTSYQDEEVQLAATTTATATHSLLQSVKEEDSEDALEDEGSDGGGCCDVIEKVELADGAEVNTPEQQQQQQQQFNNGGKKSMRSKRRREIQHDHPHHDLNKSSK